MTGSDSTPPGAVPPVPVPPGAAELARRLAGAHGAALVHLREIPDRAARPVPLPDWTDPALRAALAGRGIGALWSHQAEVAELARAGRHAVVATGTASGKTLGFLLPALTDVLAGSRSPAGGDACVLYVAPTKALAADQAARIRALGLEGVRVATYDGDTPADERAWARRHANVVLTNPDMLHRAILPGHEHWAAFLRRLRHVVVDECHVYRGVFGSHVAAVLRRLRRLASRRGEPPTFVFASATAADPAAQCTALIGAPVTAVVDDGSPRAAATFAFLDPGATTAPVSTDGTVPDDESGTRPRPGTLSVAADVLAGLVADGVQTVAFARSRQGVEVVAARARATLARDGWPEPAETVAAYRGGYLPEDRRRLEGDLRSGRLRGLATTSALELGIDISGLDAIVLAGWPGTRASLWQRAGRAGRSGRPSLTVLVAGEDPLDHYLVHHPDAVFDPGVEASVLDPGNPHVLGPHLAAAAAESPLRPDELDLFGPGAAALLDALVARGLLRRRRDGWYWARPEHPAEHIALRGTADLVRIVEQRTGRVLGTVDAPRADAAVHTGAVHLHRSRPYVVTDLDLDDGAALVVPGDPGWITQARSVSAFDVVDERERLTRGATTVSFGAVAVRSQVTSFLRRRPDGAVLGEHPLDLPERTLATRAVWWTITPEALADAGLDDGRVPGSLHAAEHAAIGLLPLVATADRWDIGGVSTACHPDTGLPTVMVYDGHDGGAGIAERGFAARQHWLRTTREAVASCRCRSGCPACVQSPKCGNGNSPLDKAGAVVVLDLLLGTPTGLLLDPFIDRGRRGPAPGRDREESGVR